LQALYAYFQTKDEDYAVSEDNLMKAIEKIYDMYLLLLLTFAELKVVAINRIEDNKKKLRPSEEDLNPNRKWIDNAIVQLLEDHPELKALAEKRKLNWEGAENREMFRKMFLAMREGETFFTFLNNGVSGFEEDKRVALLVFKEEIANNEVMQNYFEEHSIDWIDDLDLCCAMVIKTIKGFSESEQPILRLYKDRDDEVDFVKSLFRKTLMMDAENEVMIDELTKNWELERIAKMDIILMKMALTEMQIFSSIPTKVSLNEYIEISKFYSTPKSNGFINGVLDKAIVLLQEKNKLKKTGRGLLE